MELAARERNSAKSQPHSEEESEVGATALDVEEKLVSKGKRRRLPGRSDANKDRRTPTKTTEVLTRRLATAGVLSISHLPPARPLRSFAALNNNIDTFPRHGS
ncbi:MAG: hypothetical protein HZA90_03835 [Verrucomicrobia bacterium]|nr:hypothetical protein [Verrucomicrobiota bacterium]